jgi:acetyltransferase-like isoleucine patch superfamily enzyme
MIHSLADVQSQHIGDKTRIWQFVVILPGAWIGNDCNICAHCLIENDVIIGDRVTVKSGVQLWDGVRLEDDVFVGPNATFTNDKFPRSKRYPESVIQTIVKQGASIGANASILAGVTIGQKAMVGTGAIVTHSVPPNAIVVGNPAKIVGYVDTPAVLAGERAIKQSRLSSIVNGVQLFELKNIADLRGDLCVASFERDIPFIPKRVFFIYNVPSSRIRGEHAHKICHQFLICVKGSVSVVVDNGVHREEFILDSPYLGLYLPPKIWGIQYKYSADTILMVFASHEYDSQDYIRDYDEFLKMVNS